MNILLILAHPNKNSFNHAIAQIGHDRLLANGHTVVLHDLYAEGFDPLIGADEMHRQAQINEIVQSHCNDLIDSDGIIIVHPNWWGQPPAILKGWIDRVIRPGIAYKFEEGDNGEGVPVGLLKAKTGLVFNTSDTAEERETTIFKDPLETIWKNCIFDFCGVKTFDRKVFRIVVTSTLEQRSEWLKEAGQLVDRYFPLQVKTNPVEIKTAQLDEIDAVLRLHAKYQIDTIAEEDKTDGFVTTSFTIEQMTRLIEEENGLFIAKDNERVVGYAMAASWAFWSAWPIFSYMINRLGEFDFQGTKLTVENSYQYGPVCIDKEYRGTGLIEKLFEFSAEAMSNRYGVLVTFINKNNPRSYKAHTQKIGLEVIGEFEFNGNQYYELAYDTSNY